MSKLDSLLLLADSITARADHIVASVSESDMLIGRILGLSDSITAADSKIDSMTDLIGKNNIALDELEKLYEKSLLLEASLHSNESITNSTSLENLHSAYDHLLTSFGVRNRTLLQAEPPAKQDNQELKTMLSISNLDLKPIRCRSAKVSKQKSRYRLSAAYTLNPLGAVPTRNVLESSARTETSSIMDANSDQNGTSDNASTVGSLPEQSRISEERTFNLSDLPLLFKSTRPIDISAVDLDDLDLDFDSSIESESSPSKNRDLDMFDNFHRFLRESRVDLRSAFPAPLQKSLSHESVFSAVQYPTQNVHKFHNPADMITSKQLITQPTMETIHSLSFDARKSSNFMEHTKKLLHVEPPPATPKKNSHNLFTLLNSPLGSPRGLTSTRPSTTSASTTSALARRGSIDLLSKSLTESFKNLVGSTPVQQPRIVTATKLSPPEKIKQMKKDISEPIAVKNEINSRRLPPSERKLRLGSHSSLTIGPNKTKIINHGETSVFKKPTIRRMSQAILHDALNESLLF